MIRKGIESVWPQIMLGPAQTHRLTRLLCGAVLGLGAAMWALLLAFLAVIAVSFVTRQPVPLGDVGFPTLMVMLAANYIFGFALYVWRTCEQCRFRLYNALDARWFSSEVSRLNEAPRLAHAAAERKFGSFSYGVIWSKAHTGVAHCPWCGHADKLKLEYDVVQ